MNILRSLVSRNCKIFFRDKGIFFPSLIAPLILLFLFIAFLGNVYRDSIRSIAEGFPLSDVQVESIASGWLLSTLLAVCAVTIAFTANVTMVQDRASGQAKDLFVSPAPRQIVALSYFISTFLVTCAICLVALLGGFIYIAIAGWNLTMGDVLFTLLDTFLLVLFGTALSSIVCEFLKSQGGVTAIQVLVSSAYGFLCGAYMPIGSLVGWLRNVLMFLPGTYGTGLLHSHLMNGAIEAIATEGVPQELISGMKDGFDCNLYFFETAVSEWICYLILVGTILLLCAVYLILCLRNKKRSA